MYQLLNLKNKNMKKEFLLILFMSLLTIGVYAQDDIKTCDYNKWSIDIGAGLNKAYRSFDNGYMSATPGLWTGTVGVRYMANEYFGVRAGLGYSSFDEKDGESLPFDSHEYDFDIQGVSNMGRIMNFHNWTKTFNLLAHYGLGVGVGDFGAADKDWYLYPVAGLTGEVKLSKRIVFFADISTQANLYQEHGFDGGEGNDSNVGGVYKGTVGLSFSLGKQNKRADFSYSEKKDAQLARLNDQIRALSSKVNDNSNKIKDNTNTTDELQADVDELTKKVNSFGNMPASDYVDMTAELINNGFLNIYFDFNSTSVESSSTKNVAFLKSYMEKNPDSKVMLTGYADERGTNEYNQKLSKKRSDVVAKLLQNSGIDASKINVEGRGELSIDPNSSYARKMARKVTFTISK